MVRSFLVYKCLSIFKYLKKHLFKKQFNFSIIQIFLIFFSGLNLMEDNYKKCKLAQL